jgi:xanthine dehydrogenase small subunit
MLEVTQKQGRFDQLISLARVLELQRLEINADGAIIGSAVTYQDLQAAAELRWPALHHFLSRLGSPQIRNRGTIGGNLGTASPIGDLLPILLAMDATIVMSHFEEADQKVPISEFLQGYRKTQLQPGNVIKEVEVTGLQDFLRYYKISKRQEDDIAAVSVAVRLKLDADHITLARIAFGGVAEQALRLPALEQALQGQTITETLMTALHQQVLLALNPISDVRASRGYRREMAANLLVRALKEARGLPMPQIYGLDDA